MIDNGYSLLIGATAEKDGRQIELQYGFGFEVDLDDCVSGIDETDGLVVPAPSTPRPRICAST